MDKNDQHENPLGEELNNLPPSNGLPSIWDNISEELNASEELEVFEDAVVESDWEHLADVADFSVIKDGFETTFKTAAPPKFLWDHIEQGLESFIETDDPSAFSAIKDGFEQNYKETPAPLFTWDHLAEEIDKPEQPVIEEDYSTVKTGFEKKYSTVVLPLFTWDDLAQRMDSEAALADTAENYTIIKESFEKQFQAKKPVAGTWASLQHQLNMQTVWGRLSYAVQNIAYREWARKAMFVGAIGLLIGGGRACMNEDLSNLPLAKNISNVQTGTNSDSKASRLDNKKAVDENTEEPSNKALANKQTLEQFNQLSQNGLPQYLNVNPTSLNHSNQQDKATKHNSINPSNFDASNPSNLEQPLAANGKEETSIIKNNATKKSSVGESNLEESTATIGNENLGNNVELEHTTTSNASEGTKQNKADASNASGQEEPKEDFASSLLEEYKAWLSDYANSTYQNKIALSDQDFQQLFDADFLAEWAKQDITLDFSETKFPLLNKNQIENTAFDDMREFVEHQGVRRTQKTKRLAFELGLVGRAGTSILLGENSAFAFDSKHASRTKLRLTGGLGLQFNCSFTANDALVIGAYPYAKASQSFSGFSKEGDFETKEAKLSFVDFTLGYQRTLLRYNNLRKFPSKIYARVDVGLGYLTNGTLLIDGQAVDTDDLFNKLNVSLGLALGNTHEFGPIILDYGLVGNIGLNSIVNKHPDHEELLAPANLLNIGAYVGVRYRLFAPWNPNKGKIKQFEWSDPFYVEIPIP